MRFKLRDANLNIRVFGESAAYSRGGIVGRRLRHSHDLKSLGNKSREDDMIYIHVLNDGT